MILETKRLRLRHLAPSDYDALRRILQDPDVMYAWEHAFDDAEAHAWLDGQLARYEADGVGTWAAEEKQTGELIGLCGLMMLTLDGRRSPELGYLFQKAYWHQGFAAEAARACCAYAFDALGFDEVWALIRDNNYPSQRVAERCGMTVTGQIVKHYYGKDMPHLVYTLHRGASGNPSGAVL